jgi:hypothetical protein
MRWLMFCMVDVTAESARIRTPSSQMMFGRLT